MPYLNNPTTGLPSTLTADASGNLTFTGRWIQSTNGAASAPPMSLTGTWFTGGLASTTKPQLLIEPAGTTSASWSTAGTGLGVNAPSGFTGNLLDLQVNGSSLFRVQPQQFASHTIIASSLATRINTIGVGINKIPQNGFDLDINGLTIFRSAIYTYGVNFVTDDTTGTKFGTATTQKFAFYNATPVAQPAAVADATDAASVITQLNMVLARLRTLGLIAT